MRVVLDTNVLISALVFGGVPQTLLQQAIVGRFQPVTSPTLLDELDEKLTTKFRWQRLIVAATRLRLENICDVVSTTDHLSVIKEDPDDDRVLECAIAGRANYIISGDRHLLKLGLYEGIVVLSIRQFMDILNPTT